MNALGVPHGMHYHEVDTGQEKCHDSPMKIYFQ